MNIHVISSSQLILILSIVIQLRLLLTPIMSVVNFSLSGVVLSPLILTHLLLGLKVLEVNIRALNVSCDMVRLEVVFIFKDQKVRLCIQNVALARD